MHDIVTGERNVEEARGYYAMEFLDARRKKPTPYMDELKFERVPRRPTPMRFPLVCRRVLNRDMSVPLTFVIFDVLWHKGIDLTTRPYPVGLASGDLDFTPGLAAGMAGSARVELAGARLAIDHRLAAAASGGRDVAPPGRSAGRRGRVRCDPARGRPLAPAACRGRRHSRRTDRRERWPEHAHARVRSQPGVSAEMRGRRSPLAIDAGPPPGDTLASRRSPLDSAP